MLEISTDRTVRQMKPQQQQARTNKIACKKLRNARFEHLYDCCGVFGIFHSQTEKIIMYYMQTPYVYTGKNKR